MPLEAAPLPGSAGGGLSGLPLPGRYPWATARLDLAAALFGSRCPSWARDRPVAAVPDAPVGLNRTGPRGRVHRNHRGSAGGSSEPWGWCPVAAAGASMHPARNQPTAAAKGRHEQTQLANLAPTPAPPLPSTTRAPSTTTTVDSGRAEQPVVSSTASRARSHECNIHRRQGTSRGTEDSAGASSNRLPPCPNPHPARA